MTGDRPKRAPGSYAPRHDGWVRLRSKAGRKDGALPDVGFQYAPVGGADWTWSRPVGQAGVAAQVAGGRDDGIDPHRPPALRVLLDPRVLV